MVASLLDLMNIVRPGNSDGGAQAAEAWAKQDATPQAMEEALNLGNTLKTPQEGSQLMSSGPQGGWFPGDPRIGLSATATYGGGRGPPGFSAPSTNNWRLLPQGFNSPDYMMRSGHIINRAYAGDPAAYVASHGGGGGGLGRGGYNYPASTGSFLADYGLFWPGQVEPWEYAQGERG
jgi:hypothetical protein